MFGLLLRSIQAYLRGTFGPALWARVLRAAGQPPEGFEPMLPYDAAVVDRVLAAAAQELHRPAEAMLEDVGTFLVADPGHRALRRLLRFGGASFADFLHSLEELPDRARLSLPGLDLPQIALTEAAPGRFRLAIASPLPALFPVALGALRAMADDYGALVLIDLAAEGDRATLTVQLLEAAHGAGRGFALAGGPADGR
ncbi:heme NO-binding protein [Rhodobacter sp. SGA-6-6]|uniref:heme NO-binding domain-containing protein n=1 Tax=Rhodobacter sp. SGA-6-6 TaxID=2710882 RepID=UPI0013EB9B4F|nr:heme NO-binding domain-containing protein [Rhodobacter sp. SGA-6-6]NGM46357.1 heme NO-binding protein [Rhodobacter sp. SGA-6-6]